jgi:hypothetical protein
MIALRNIRIVKTFNMQGMKYYVFIYYLETKINQDNTLNAYC